MARVLAPFLFPGSSDPNDPNNRCTIPPSQGNYWQTPLFTNAQAMIAYWRVRKWRIDVNVSDYVVGSIGCDVEMDATDESQLVCLRQADGFADGEMSVPTEGFDTGVYLEGIVNPFGIEIGLYFDSVPEGGDSFIKWETTDVSGPYQITLTMGSITKNLVGAYSYSLPITATGTMNAVEWWSYDGLYNTSTGEPL
jgi:hypothetical protein